MIKITGHTPNLQRVITGFTSFDHAFADQKSIGFPLGQITELYGPNGVGKSTIVYSIAGILARETKSNIAIADFEGINRELMISNLELQGFDGEVHIILEKKDEEALQTLLDLTKKNYSVGIIDAVGSISPVSEAEGDLGDSNMGRRAFLMAQFSRKGNHILINHPDKSLFLINHQHSRIGGIGTITPGGDTKKYAASIRIQISRMRRKNKEETFPDGSYIIQGDVKKNRWGLRDKEFYLFVLAGKGCHLGLTAMYDGFQSGLVQFDRTIKIGDQNFGYLKELISHAQDGDDEYFQPFIDVLKVQENTVFTEEDKETEDEGQN